MQSVTLYHNPKCSKSRAALAWLRENEVVFNERLYLSDPLNRDELVALFDALEHAPIAAIRQKETAFKQMGLNATSATDALIDAVVAAPIILERPIIVVNGRAFVARTPQTLDNVAALLELEK